MYGNLISFGSIASRSTYIFSESDDVEVDGLHVDPNVVDSPILYLSLFEIIPSSLALINLILLERSCRTRTCVVKLAKKLRNARLQVGNLQKKHFPSLWMMRESFFRSEGDFEDRKDSTNQI